MCDLSKSARAFGVGVTVGLLLILAASQVARSEEATPKDWERPEQVLEIPQACVPDGVVIICDAPASESTLFRFLTSDIPDPAPYPAAVTSESPNIDEATNDPSLGNLQDYENRATVEALVAGIHDYNDGVGFSGAPGGPKFSERGAASLSDARPVAALARTPGLHPRQHRAHGTAIRIRPRERRRRLH